MRRVLTDQGAIDCETVVNAAGMWSRDIGLLMGVRVPSIAVEHQYLITDPIPELTKNMPTFRDPDLRIYYKPEVRGIVIGGWEEGTPAFGEQGIPPEFGQQLLEGNFERFQVLAEAAFKRTPIVEKVGVRQLINGPIPFSADGEFVMGKAPELDNAFVCAGFTYGIAGGGGAGEMMAEWIVEGRPSLNLWPLDIRRFSYHHAARHFAYPSGKAEEIPDAARGAVKKAGFETAVTTLPGQAAVDDDPLWLSRIGIDPGADLLWFRRCVAAVKVG